MLGEGQTFSRDSSVEGAILGDAARERRIRDGSKMLLRAIWREHPITMRRSFILSRIEAPVPIRPPRVTWRTYSYAPSFGKELIRDVATAFSARPTEITGDGRWPHLVEARACVVKILRERGWSYPQIGRLIDRDHSSAINLHRKWVIYCARSPRLREFYRAYRAGAL